jgi:WD40 repeat protein
VVSGSSDGTLKVWDLNSRAELAILSGHSQGVNSVAITPDGRRVASGSRDRTLKVWDLDSSSELTSFEADRAVSSCVVAPDGKLVVAAPAERGELHFLQLEGSDTYRLE